MTDIELLIQTAENLCGTLDALADQDKRFCVDMQLMLEKTSWSLYKHMNDLKDISHYYGYGA